MKAEFASARVDIALAACTAYEVTLRISKALLGMYMAVFARSLRRTAGAYSMRPICAPRAGNHIRSQYNCTLLCGVWQARQRAKLGEFAM